MSPRNHAPTLEPLRRELAPQGLGAVARRHGDFAAAEDALQEALIAAVVQWPEAGVPANPRGWLYHVALRRLTDHLRSELARVPSGPRRLSSVAGGGVGGVGGGIAENPSPRQRF